ncbi:hypothetical protein BASA83_007504 [Batrachochytrium salamandrivorans]|nr:hypothetical protein BASA83_007504 [Batrachochytrium salamandrivorans]
MPVRLLNVEAPSCASISLRGWGLGSMSTVKPQLIYMIWVLFDGIATVGNTLRSDGGFLYGIAANNDSALLSTSDVNVAIMLNQSPHISNRRPPYPSQTIP